MELLITLGILAIVIQVAIFIYGRKLKQKEKSENILYKYHINTRQELWQKLADPETPEEDRKKLQEHYDKED